MSVFQRRYPNKIEFDASPGVNTWVVLATDGTVYGSLALLTASGKLPWPRSYTLAGVIQPGLEQNTGLGSLLAQTDAGGVAGSGFYLEYNLATAPATDNPATFTPAGGTYAIDDVGTLNNVWVRLLTASDKLRLTVRF
jgi:hypothetical protein